MLTVHMDTPTAPIAIPHWRTVLLEQGATDRNRTLRWLAEQTGKSARTVYAYSRGELIPTPEWIADASRVLGQEVAA